MSWNGLQQASRNPANRDSDAEKFSPGAERKERILRLRLANEVRRTSIEVLRQSTITVSECEASMDRIKAAFGNELLRLPPGLCHQLANREPQHIQQVLEGALRSALERLSKRGNHSFKFMISQRVSAYCLA